MILTLQSLGKEVREEQRKKYSEKTKTVEWKIEMACRGVYSEDGLEYEGDIIAIESTEEGHKYATVRFIGYGKTFPNYNVNARFYSKYCHIFRERRSNLAGQLVAFRWRRSQKSPNG